MNYSDTWFWWICHCGMRDGLFASIEERQSEIDRHKNLEGCHLGSITGTHDERPSTPREAAAMLANIRARELPIEPDPVHSPPHYTQRPMECIDVIEAILTPEEFRGFCLGNALKYRWRAPHKGKEAEDKAKAEWYLGRLAG